MSKKCEVCGKGPTVGNIVSHAENKTKRRWLPNLQKINVMVEGKRTKIKVCTKCLKANKVSK